MKTIETLHAERLPEHVERLAHHAVRGEVWGKAAQYLRQAGARAFDRSANREAVAWFEQALSALKQLPETRGTIELAIDLRFDLRNALHALGEFGKIRVLLREAERLAETLGDERRLGRVFGHLTLSLGTIGEYERAIESGHRALAIAEPTGDLGIQVVASLYLGMAHFNLGGYRRATEFQRRLIARLEADHIHERFGLPGVPAVIARCYLALSYAELGEFSDAALYGEEAIQIAARVAQPYSQIIADFWVGYLYLRKGDLDKATRLLERALALWRGTDIPFLFPFPASLLGSAYALSGRVDDGLSLLKQAVERSSRMQLMLHSFLVGLQSEAYLLAGRMDDAAELAGMALDLARSRKARGFEAWTLRLLGEIALRRDPLQVEDAEAPYRQSMALADELGMRPLAAHCHLGLGKLHRRTGKREQAHDHLAAATTMYREMDMRFWLDQAEAEERAMGATPYTRELP